MKTSACETVVGDTPADAAQLAAERIASIISERTGDGGECFIALSGGTTPGELYRRLAAPLLCEKLPWNRVKVFFGDERDVPADHVESNYRMAARNLLDHVPILPVNVHPMPADSPDLSVAAERYEEMVRKFVPAGTSGVPCFDLILLGLGGDGHVASLFPGTPALDERERLVTAQFVPIVGRSRMTFTFPLINGARNVLFFVTGADKADAVAATLSGDVRLQRRYPSGQVCPAGGKAIFVLDAAAARQVRYSRT